MLSFIHLVQGLRTAQPPPSGKCCTACRRCIRVQAGKNRARDFTHGNPSHLSSVHPVHRGFALTLFGIVKLGCTGGVKPFKRAGCFCSGASLLART